MEASAREAEPRALIRELAEHLGAGLVREQVTADGTPTVWVPPGKLHDALSYAKQVLTPAFRMLYDLTAIDERRRAHRGGQPEADFSVVYHLLSLERNEQLRVKVALEGESPHLPSVTSLWACADWYECEIYDMFGIRFEGHPHLRRILMPRTWEGHPLRKDHYARATEAGPFELPPEKVDREQEALRFRPEEWGMERERAGTDFMFLNLGPQHPGTHGVLRVILQLDGEEIVDLVPEIGFHHRGAEKMGERQSWHSYIPYTDRVDYLGGVLNNLPYCLAVEQLAGIEVPPRAQVIRVMMSELYRIASHLVWYGTFAQDIGALSPVFYMFTDRERILEITEAICGGRMHPSWFRIGGVAQDLPGGWDRLVRAFIQYLPKRLNEYDTMVMKNDILKGRTQGVGDCTLDEAIDWGMTGPGLRACGLEFDLRKRMPYSGYDQFDFEIPIAHGGDCYDRAKVRVLEMRQSLRILDQCVKHMPGGPYKADHPQATPPMKERTMQDIETLITHFLGVSWGPVVPPGEATVLTEASKGANSYYLTSDGGTMSYRTRIRAPSFPHMQMLPMMTRGLMIPDLMAILGAMDFVLADIDR